jgi:carboxymethylenebutenolidase
MKTARRRMQRRDTSIKSKEGPDFDCYVVASGGGPRVPAIVLCSAIHGVDADLRAIADDFAVRGFLAAAPDLFWRSLPGPLKRDDPRSRPRGQPRLEKIRAGEQDLADTLAMLRREPSFNGKAAVIGFCYGGPCSILGPRRLGYAAGISGHGTQILDYRRGAHLPRHPARLHDEGRARRLRPEDVRLLDGPRARDPRSATLATRIPAAARPRGRR